MPIQEGPLGGKPTRENRPIKKALNHMKWLTLEDIKQQLRLEPDYTLEDPSLIEIGESAEETVLEYTGRSYDEIVEKWGSFPKNLVRASKLLCTIAYEQPSGVSQKNLVIVPYGNIDMLIKPYTKL